MAELSGGDWDLLVEMRDCFPLVARPYMVLADRLMWHEQVVLSRAWDLRRRGALRRVGAAFDMGRLGRGGVLTTLEMTRGDITLVRALWQDLPLAPRPFLILARRVGRGEEALLAAAERFVAAGLMLRYGARLGRGL